MVQDCFLSQGKIQKFLDLRCWDGAHRRVLAVSTFVCLRLTTCADRASAIPGSPPTHAALCQAAHQEREGVQMCRQNRVLLSQDRCCPLSSPFPFSLFSPFPALTTCLSVQLPPPQGNLRASHAFSRGLHYHSPPLYTVGWVPGLRRSPGEFPIELVCPQGLRRQEHEPPTPWAFDPASNYR